MPEKIVLVGNIGHVLMRAIRFLCGCIRLRSISRALWVDAYDQAGWRNA